jgi:putative peptidoglycan lipid II flippase
MVPAAVGLLALAHPTVAIFKVGKVTGDDITRLAGILRAFSVGLPAFSAYLLLMNACKAMRDTRITFIVNAVENASNIVLASVFLLAGWGVAGLALAFALAYVIGAALALVVVRQRLHGLNDRVLLSATARIGVASALMGAAVVGTSELVAAILGDQGGRPAALVQVGAAVVVGVTVYAIAGRLVGVSEITTVIEGLTRRLTRRPAR